MIEKNYIAYLFFPKNDFLSFELIDEIISEASFEFQIQTKSFSEIEDGFSGEILLETTQDISEEELQILFDDKLGYFVPIISGFQPTDEARVKNSSKPQRAKKPSFSITKNKPIKLWVDDIRDPVIFTKEEDWVWVKTAEEALWVLKNRNVTRASFDHDLGEVKPGLERKNGYDLIKWIEEEKLWPSENIAVHSDNAVGVKNIIAAINTSGQYTMNSGRKFEGKKEKD